LIAGITNFVLALALGMRVPSPVLVATATTIGFLGYGASLALFVLALRALGSARAGAYFSTAPFLGAVIAILVFHEPVQSGFVIAALLMASGCSCTSPNGIRTNIRISHFFTVTPTYMICTIGMGMIFHGTGQNHTRTRIIMSL
jgi:drug/metabolite transporter (DMT)-like permease